MEPGRVFRYQPTCNAPECREPAVYKVAAVWSDGTSRELKNYGLACEAHRDSQLELARGNHRMLRLAEGETVGPVELYVLKDGCRDAELARVAQRGEAGGS
ncbi:MAG: hypothetical protein ACLQIB_41880 [Isosphaeraceae bacterium]